MRVPCGAGSRFKGDDGTTDTGEATSLERRVDAHRAREPVVGAFSGRLGTNSLYFHLLLSFERSHIDREPVFHVAFEHAGVGFIDLLDRGDFHVGSDIVLGAEIEHFLRFSNSPDERTGQAASSHDQGKGGDGMRFLGCADEGEVAVDL